MRQFCSISPRFCRSAYLRTSTRGVRTVVPLLVGGLACCYVPFDLSLRFPATADAAAVAHARFCPSGFYFYLSHARSLARTASHVFFAHLSYRRVKTRGPAGEAKTDRKTRVKSSQAKRQQTTPPPKTPKLRAKRARQLASEPPY